MALPVIADTIRTAVEGTLSNGAHFANILHFRKSGAITYAAAIAILDPILLNLYYSASGGNGAWNNWSATSCHLDQFRYTPLDGTSATSTITHTNAGAGTGDVLPQNVALVTTLYTALRGRSRRGRCYWCGFTEGGNQTTGFPVATVSQIQTRWNDMLTALVGSGVSLVVASYLLASAENVTSAVVRQTHWSTQRRRLAA